MELHYWKKKKNNLHCERSSRDKRGVWEELQRFLCCLSFNKTRKQVNKVRVWNKAVCRVRAVWNIRFGHTHWRRRGDLKESIGAAEAASSRNEACAIRETRVTVEGMCNNVIRRRYAELGIDLPIKTPVDSLLHLSDLSENCGISEVVAGGVVKKKHIRWNYFEDEKDSAICYIPGVPFLERKRNQRASVCERCRLLGNLATLYRVWVGHIYTSIRREVKSDARGEHIATKINHRH